MLHIEQARVCTAFRLSFGAKDRARRQRGFAMPTVVRAAFAPLTGGSEIDKATASPSLILSAAGSRTPIRWKHVLPHIATSERAVVSNGDKQPQVGEALVEASRPRA